MGESSSQSVPCTLATLHSHSIFIPADSSDVKPEVGWEIVDRPGSSGEDLVPLKKQRLVMRDKEIVLATGNEVRLANLSGDRVDVRNGRVGSYSSLTSPNLSFPILSLNLSPNRRFLAVLGRSQLVVLILPKPGSAIRGDTPCKSIVIDQHEYAAASSVVITKVLWHPLGQNGESLWVLTSDARLREYDITSPYDPVQTFSFLLSSATSSSRFSAVDPLSRYATSFAFGSPSRAGWGECAIHGLMANGELYTLCPVLPFRAEAPLKWIQRLKAYTQAAGSEEEAHWVEGLARQVKLSSEGSEGSGTPNIRTSILGRTKKPSNAQKAGTTEVNGDQMVLLHPPHMTAAGGPAPGVHLELERQGPAVFSPSPDEADDDDVASDLLLCSVGDGKDRQELHTINICWSSGRLDVGLLVGRQPGRWAGQGDSRDKSARKPAAIPIVESIQLDIREENASDNAPAIVLDAVHTDTFHVRHSEGVDAVSLGGLANALISAEGDVPGCDVARLSSTDPATNGVEGLATCYNMSLGYGILALGATNRLAALELDMRNDTGADVSIKPETTADTRADEPDQASLIISQPLDYDKLINSIRVPPSLSNARAALKKLSMPNKPLTTIGPEHLRAIGDLIANLQSRIELVRTASAAVERHLDRQVKEFQRQLQLLQQTSINLAAVKKHTAVSRAEGLLAEQEKLAERMDSVLSGLTERYRPPVGEVERKWFEQLEGLKVKVRGGKGFGLSRGGGLQAQVDELEEQLDDLKPKAEAAKKDAEQAQTTSPRRKAHSAKELRPLEGALYQRIDEIGRLMRKMESLKVQVEDAIDKSVGPG